MSDQKTAKPERLAYWGGDLVLEAEFPGSATCPPVKFRYHPVNYKDFEKIQEEAFESAKNGRMVGQSLRIVQRHLHSWDAKKPDGSLVNWKIDEEARCVAPQLIDFVYTMIVAPAQRVDASPIGMAGILGN